MPDDGCIVECDECLVGAFAALNPREFANTRDKLITTRRRVPGPSCLLADEPCRKDVLPPPEQGAEKLYLRGWCLGNRDPSGLREMHSNFRLGPDGGPLGAQRCQAVSRLCLLSHKPRKMLFRARNGLEQPLA